MEFVFNNDNTLDDTIQTSSYTPNPNQTDLLNTAASPIKRTRRSVATASNVEFEEPTKRRRTSRAKVNYVKPVKKARARKSTKSFEWTWAKIGWAGCFCLCLRLVFMNQGLIDFYAMENTLDERSHDLELIRIENAELITEINKIKTSPRYQRKITREHLGVIAKDEYLVLFASDS